MNIFNVYIKFGCYLNLVIWLRFKVFFFIIFNLWVKFVNINRKKILN